MKRSLSLVLGFILLSTASGRAQETPPAPPPASPSADQAASAPATSAAQEVLRLKEAGYSEEFLLNKIRRENKSYSLTTDDLVQLRKAGLSETVIDALLRSGNPAPAATGASATAGGAPAPAATPATAPAAAPAQASPAVMTESSPAASPASAPAATTATADLAAGTQSFDGLVRQKHGFLGIGGSKKKAIGKFVVDKEQIHWYQSVDPEDNFSSFIKNIKEMWLNCAPRAGENLCLELCFKTYSGDEWCFRDTGWDNGTNKQVTAVFDYFQKTFPATFFSKREKKSF